MPLARKRSLEDVGKAQAAGHQANPLKQPYIPMQPQDKPLQRKGGLVTGEGAIHTTHQAMHQLCGNKPVLMWGSVGYTKLKSTATAGACHPWMNSIYPEGLVASSNTPNLTPVANRHLSHSFLGCNNSDESPLRAAMATDPHHGRAQAV